jgi:hypothetical protein
VLALGAPSESRSGNRVERVYGPCPPRLRPSGREPYGATFALVWDADKSIATSYKPETVPTSFLVDTDGIVRFARASFHDGEEAAFDGEILGLDGRKARRLFVNAFAPSGEEEIEECPLAPWTTLGLV